jgi:hypothetical protein
MIAVIIGITTKTPGTRAAKTISIATERAWTVGWSPEAHKLAIEAGLRRAIGRQAGDGILGGLLERFS